jgi:prepilin-type N-terminal cleavage/methylation domain-containing protein
MKKGFTNTPVILSVSEGSRNGFTLMELLVYMMIVGIIVVIAGHAFSNSTKFRVRTQNMLKATQEAENVATLFKADVSQMGAKTSLEGGASENGAEFGLKFFSVCVGEETENCIPKTVYVNPDAAADAIKILRRSSLPHQTGKVISRSDVSAMTRTENTSQ